MDVRVPYTHMWNITLQMKLFIISQSAQGSQNAWKRDLF